MTEKQEYKDTVFLPKTEFPMKAGLPQKEPGILARWEEQDLYHRLREARAGREKFILHDGPPYANGVMLLTLDELGFTLWGWPNRFLERMAKAKSTVIIAQDVTDGEIKGLTDVRQYGAIASSFNGYVWVDRIEELGPALRR